MCLMSNTTFSLPQGSSFEQNNYLNVEILSDKKPEEVMADYFSAVSSQNINQILKVFDKNATIETDQNIFKGHKEIKAFYENGILKFRQFHPEPGPLLIKDNYVAVEIILCGNGKKRKVGDFFEIHQGVIKRMVVYSGPSEW